MKGRGGMSGPAAKAGGVAAMAAQTNKLIAMLRMKVLV
jgi:hypothetical protein